MKNRTSKPADAYSSYTRTVAALKRASAAGLDTAPGQDVEYVVGDDAESRERVRLCHEDGEGYDVEFYREQLVKAAESVDKDDCVTEVNDWGEGPDRRHFCDLGCSLGFASELADSNRSLGPGTPHSERGEQP